MREMREHKIDAINGHYIDIYAIDDITTNNAIPYIIPNCYLLQLLLLLLLLLLLFLSLLLLLLLIDCISCLTGHSCDPFIILQLLHSASRPSPSTLFPFSLFSLSISSVLGKWDGRCNPLAKSSWKTYGCLPNIGTYTISLSIY